MAHLALLALADIIPVLVSIPLTLLDNCFTGNAVDAVVNCLACKGVAISFLVRFVFATDILNAYVDFTPVMFML